MNNKKYQHKLKSGAQEYNIFDINKASEDLGFNINNLPYSLRILFENVLRNSNDIEELTAFKNWIDGSISDTEISFFPSRVLMQDFTGVPAVVDLAAMRDAMQLIGKNPLKINPMIPVDLVIDHSLQVDYFGSEDALNKNVALEMKRNIERYEFLKWGQKSFNNFRVVPPGRGICHQVNLEFLAQVVCTKNADNTLLAYPDTVVGTDSHTTMINGLSVLGWGVGGIEAEAAMLGRAIPMTVPEVVGFKLTGKLADTITATDLVLTITQILRKEGVVGKFVEFFGNGIQNLSLADRATIANMAPEYGATCGFFPTDDETIKYLKLTSRDTKQIELVIEYTKHQSLWYRESDDIKYNKIITLDLSTLKTSIAGPKRPQDRLDLNDISSNFKETLPTLSKGDSDINKKYHINHKDFSLSHGSIVIAAITSCTNTSNPSVMIAAGLLAKKAYNLGLTAKPWVKTSLAPGSQIVTQYLKASKLDGYLNHLGFNTVGYGCTTCIGNSGKLDADIENTIQDNKLVVASVLSGNRNFEGRVHPLVRANYLASPPLVVAYAIAGDINIDITCDPISKTKEGKDVYLQDIFPTKSEIHEYINMITPQMFKDNYSQIFDGDKFWQDIKIEETSTYKWNNKSTYIKCPPYFNNIQNTHNNIQDIKNAKILAIFGDSITTDHISPAGNISQNSPAGKYLSEKGIAYADFNSYGARRGNHEVMMRGTFANIRIKNEMCAGVEGGVTINQITGQQMSIYDCAMEYKTQNIPLVIFAGKEYGTGSSRDWAAKGTNLLGVKAVIAESFERIHRSNLVGMGVLPMVFANGQTRKSYNLIGDEEIEILDIDKIKPYAPMKCSVKRKKGTVDIIDLILQIITESEIEYIKHGSVMHAVINNY